MVVVAVAADSEGEEVVVDSVIEAVSEVAVAAEETEAVLEEAVVVVVEEVAHAEVNYFFNF